MQNVILKMSKEPHGFDSQEEYWFSEWCRELGLNYAYKPKTYVLSDTVKLKQQKQRSICDVHLLNDCTYTPDFILEPLLTSIGDISFYVDIYTTPLQKSLKSSIFKASGLEVLIDTKGSNFMSSQRTSDVRFSLVQKWMYAKHKLYVNSVVPQKLFEQTFAPECFFWSETGKERMKKVNGEFISLGRIFKRIGDINYG